MATTHSAVLAPGSGKPRPAYLDLPVFVFVVFVTSGRLTGARPPAGCAFFYSSDRKGEHPRATLERFTGVLHADVYASSTDCSRPGRVIERLAWAHVAQVLFDVHAATASLAIAKEALDRIRPSSHPRVRRSMDHPRHPQQRQLRSQPIAGATCLGRADRAQAPRANRLAAASAICRAPGRR